jgi:hypothetical protein
MKLIDEKPMKKSPDTVPLRNDLLSVRDQFQKKTGGENERCQNEVLHEI